MSAQCLAPWLSGMVDPGLVPASRTWCRSAASSADPMSSLQHSESVQCLAPWLGGMVDPGLVQRCSFQCESYVMSAKFH